MSQTHQSARGEFLVGVLAMEGAASPSSVPCGVSRGMGTPSQQRDRTQPEKPGEEIRIGDILLGAAPQAGFGKAFLLEGFSLCGSFLNELLKGSVRFLSAKAAVRLLATSDSGDVPSTTSSSSPRALEAKQPQL